jgi:hypothetical protein
MPPYVRPSKQVGLRIPAEMLAWLEATAKAEDRSVPYLIRKIIQEQMAREPKAKKPKAKS